MCCQICIQVSLYLILKYIEIWYWNETIKQLASPLVYMVYTGVDAYFGTK